MDSQNITKINRLLRVWPPGTVAVSSWLARQGIYQQLVAGYQRSGWIKKIGRGAYSRWGDKVEWTGGVYAIQNQLDLPVHVGARTALEMQGYAHFLPLGQGTPLYLFGMPGHPLPSWFVNYKWNKHIEYKIPRLFDCNADFGTTSFSAGNFIVRVSAPERAGLELLHLTPLEQDIHEAITLIEGLRTLRPRLVQKLLETCRSIKVKRLFLALAERGQHAWFEKLDLSRIKLGAGKRRIVPGGVFDKKYQITLPKQ